VKKKPKYNQNSVIRGALRRAFARSPLVQEVMQESRREEPRYNKDGSRHKKNWVKRQCQVCNNWVSTSKMAVDHINPVVSVDDGFNDWNEFIARLWCDKTNLQRICDDCHDKKTQEERVARLLKQYTEELNDLERHVNLADGKRNLYGAGTNGYKDLIKLVNKYIAKKKTKGLEQIVERAKEIKERILILKKGYEK
jgi:5-methylcytosine-specific restriction endonuclease McrA